MPIASRRTWGDGLSTCCCAIDGARDDLYSVLELQDCVNCCADIGCKGEWTGEGWAAIRAFIRRFGIERVTLAWDKGIVPRGLLPAPREEKVA